MTEFIRGGQIAWMKDIDIKPNSVYGKGSTQSRQWWRKFIRQVAAAGYIKRTIKTASFGSSSGVYASLTVTDKARHVIDSEMGILFPLEKGDRLSTPNEVKDITRKREGKGCHLISTVKVLLRSKESWKEISDKNNYHFLGVFSEPSCNVLWYTNDVTQLSHYTLEDPDFLWNDIQFSKRSSTKQTVDLFIGEQGKKRCLYYKAQCNGVKKCCECQHVVPNSAIRNSCTEHPGSPLTRVKDCPVL